jgi:peptide/nickel transport system substrate-binding protein
MVVYSTAVYKIEYFSRGNTIMDRGYWAKVTSARISRRRAIAGSTAGFSAALLLVACGDSDEAPAGSNTSSSSSSTGSSSTGSSSAGLFSEPLDTTSSAKPGGTIRDFQTADFPHFDVASTNQSAVTQVGRFTLSKLVKYVTQKYPAQADGSVEGDLAESVEVSPDGLTVTFKVRQGAKWDSRPPTSGRVVDAEDVVFSWNKFVNLNTDALDLWYDSQRSPQGSVESVQATDDSTVVMKLRKPDSSLFHLLVQRFYIVPRESDGQFDPRSEVRGHGPYRIAEYEPSLRIVYEKNPDYYRNDRPFPDRLERPIISEYATRLAQFRAGNIMTDIFIGTQEDVVPTKTDLPDLLLLNDGSFSRRMESFITFGYEGDISQSPFKDQRLRQAASMMIDREGYLIAMENVDNFARAGIELDTAIQTVVAAGWPDYYLDPKSPEFGPSANYLEFNPSEATKLMSAVGYPDGVQSEMFFLSEETYGPPYRKSFEVMSAMLIDGGMDLKLTGLTYDNYLDNHYFGYISTDYLAGKKKGYTGVYFCAERPFPTIEITLFATMHKDGSAFHGMTPNGENAHLGDPKVNDLIDKIRTTTEKENQVGMVRDLTRYMTAQAYYLPRPSTSKPLSLWWPAIGNLGVDRTYPGGSDFINWWVDSTKPPLA